MIIQFTTLLIGFSVFSALALAFAYIFFLKGMQKSTVSKVACVALLGGLLCLQLSHYQHIAQGADLLNTRQYALLLLAVPPSFFFFSRAVLFQEPGFRIWDLLHSIPLIVGGLIAPLYVVPPAAFLIGTLYTVWFGKLLLNLRVERTRFKFEISFLALFAFFAIAALLLGLSLPYIDPEIFYLAYANAIGISFFLVISALIIFPELLSDIADIAEHSYANSKLTGIDTEAMISRLSTLMQKEAIYQNENLKLEMLAEMLELSSHQLSELINTKFGCSYTRYIREQRISAAKRILTDEPNSSILSVSLEVGFKSQSNFYAAFREIVGESPGSFRKNIEKS